MIQKNLETINSEALQKSSLAHSILKKIEINPNLCYVQDITLSNISEPRWNEHFVIGTLDEIKNLYGSVMVNESEIPQPVREFMRDAYKYNFNKRRDYKL